MSAAAAPATGLKTEDGKPLYGLVAEFDSADKFFHSCEKVRDAGYKKTDAYTPFPIEHLEEAIGHGQTKLSYLIFIGGIIGAAGGFGLATWASMIAYPLNIGGRPYFSWPSFIPVTFECMVLLASFTAVFGMIGLNGLPQPYHPIFNAKNFERASVDRFFILIEADDLKFEPAATKKFLESLNPLGVADCAQ